MILKKVSIGLDIEGVIFRQGKTLEIAYFSGWIYLTSVLLEKPGIITRFEEAWNV